MSEEWGPWIEHDGRGCPCEGAFVESETADGEVLRHTAMGHFGGIGNPVNCWDWKECYTRGVPHWRLLRYRIRKPRGLSILEEIARGVKQPEDA